MSQLFQEAAAEVREILINDGASQKTLDEHRRCHEVLGEYLTASGQEFSEDAMIPWLKSIKESRSKDTYVRYRRCSYRILRYVQTGSIEYGEGLIGFHSYQYFDSKRTYVTLSPGFRELCKKYIADAENRFCQWIVIHNCTAVSAFLAFLESEGVENISDVDISHLVQIYDLFSSNSYSDSTVSKHRTAIGDFIHFLSDDNIPWCYEYYLSVIGYATDIPVIDESVLAGYERKAKPSLELEGPLNGFAQLMKERRYSIEFFEHKWWVFAHFFLFLEVNRLAFTKEAVLLWISASEPIPSLKSKAQYIRWFYEYVMYGTIHERSGFFDSDPMKDLPDWSRGILESCIRLKEREGMSPSTLCHYRSSGLRLFRFLDGCGVNSCDEITPEILMEFLKQDHHETPEGKNANMVKVRKILSFMAEEGLVPYTYVLTITTTAAPVVKIPRILSDEMIQSLYDYRANAGKAPEYRNSAMIMLGLRMGLRASDVADLELGSIDWKEQKISITQKKTGKPLVLPMPVEVANSLYMYITRERPEPAKGAEKYVFIKGSAPHSKLSRVVTRSALEAALKSKGFKLEKGQGFHILRKTFATNLLKASVDVHRIAESLGHASENSVRVYLSVDENGMRHCPLPFSRTGGCHV